MSRRILCLLLCVLMVICMMPATAAAYPTTANVTINGVSFAGNAYYRNGDTTTFTGTAYNYNAWYDASSGTLHLNNFNGGAISSHSADPLIIDVMNGTKNYVTVAGTSPSQETCGIQATGDLTITGRGQLTVDVSNSHSTNVTSGIYSGDKLTINDRANVNVSAEDGAYTYALRAQSGVSIAQYCAVTLNAYAADSGSRAVGIYTYTGAISITTGWNTDITLDGWYQAGTPYGILNAAAGTSDDNGDISIYNAGDVYITTHSGPGAVGICTDGNANNTDGVIEVMGTNLHITDCLHGIYSVSAARATDAADILLEGCATIDISSQNGSSTGISSAYNGIYIEDGGLNINTRGACLNTTDVMGSRVNNSTYGVDIAGAATVTARSVSGYSIRCGAPQSVCSFDLTEGGRVTMSGGGPNINYRAFIQKGTGVNILNTPSEYSAINQHSTVSDAWEYTCWPQPFTFAYGDPYPDAENIYVNGHAFSASKQYYHNGSADTDSNSSGYNAYYDFNNGVLTLSGYNDGPIAVTGNNWGAIRIKLVGSNMITADSPVDAFGIATYNVNPHDVIITADADADLTLNIVSEQNAVGICGNFTNDAGAVYVMGHADVTANVSTSGTSYTAAGVYSQRDVTISGDASLTAVVSNACTNSEAYAYGLCSKNGSTTIDTTGTVVLDSSDCPDAMYSHAIKGPATLLNAGRFSAAWKYWDGGHNGYLSDYNGGKFANDTMGELEDTYAVNRADDSISYVKGTAYTVTAYAGETEMPQGKYVEGETVTVSGIAGGLYSFVGWEAEGITFADPTAETTSFTMPAGDVVVNAVYDVFPTAPSFERLSDTTGTVSYVLASLPDYVVSLVTSGGIYSGGTFIFDSLNTINVNCETDSTNQPAGSYRLIVPYGSTYYPSPAFEIDYTDPDSYHFTVQPADCAAGVSGTCYPTWTLDFVPSSADDGVVIQYKNALDEWVLLTPHAGMSGGTVIGDGAEHSYTCRVKAQVSGKNIWIYSDEFTVFFGDTYTISASPAAIAFGDVQKAASYTAKTADITNTGTHAYYLEFECTDAAITNSFTISVDNILNEMQPGSLYTLTVQPKSTIAPGEYDFAITLKSNDGGDIKSTTLLPVTVNIVEPEFTTLPATGSAQPDEDYTVTWATDVLPQIFEVQWYNVENGLWPTMVALNADVTSYTFTAPGYEQTKQYRIAARYANNYYVYAPFTVTWETSEEVADLEAILNNFAMYMDIGDVTVSAGAATYTASITQWQDTDNVYNYNDTSNYPLLAADTPIQPGHTYVVGINFVPVAPNTLAANPTATIFHEDGYIGLTENGGRTYFAAVTAPSSSPATGVVVYEVDGSEFYGLNSSTPYWVGNGPAASGSLDGSQCTAQFDAQTGTLTLYNYSGGSIVVNDALLNDLTVNLIGNNSITTTGFQAGIKSRCGTITITSSSEGTLEINATASSDDVAGIMSGYGNETRGSVVIGGSANVTVSVTNNATVLTDKAYGIYAYSAASITGDAYYTANIVAKADNTDMAYGIYAGADNEHGVTVNTNGNVYMDNTGSVGRRSYLVYDLGGDSPALTKVGTMDLRVKSDPPYTRDAYPSWNYDNDHVVLNTAAFGGDYLRYVYRYGNKHSVSVTKFRFDAYNSEIIETTSPYLEGDTATITAPVLPSGLPFKEWTSDDPMSFTGGTSATDSTALLTVGNTDVTVRATYNVFTTQPAFEITGEVGMGDESPKGRINYGITNGIMPTYLYVVPTTGYVYGQGGPQCEVIAYAGQGYEYKEGENGNGCIGIASNTYRLAAQIDDIFFYSDPFVINFNSPLTFDDSAAYDIPTGEIGHTYTATTALTASGGLGPYTFTIETPVDGLSINGENKLVFTRPSLQSATQTTIRVTDSSMPATWRAITVDIGAVIPVQPGHTVEGVFRSWNNSDDASYLLYDSSVTSSAAIADATGGSPSLNIAIIPVTGLPSENAGMYEQNSEFDSISDGDYTIVITKPGKYVPKAVEVTMNGSDNNLGTVQLWLYGDVNYDGLVDADDVMQINRYAAGLSSAFNAGDSQIKHDRNTSANVTSIVLDDSDIDADDVMQIDRYAAGLPSVFDIMH